MRTTKKTAVPAAVESLTAMHVAVTDPPPVPVTDDRAVESNSTIAQDRELLSAFVEESEEHLEAMEAGMLAIERDPSDREKIHATFRACHTIKGLAGFLDLTPIQRLAHELETLLDRARNGVLTIGPEANDVVLHGVDVLRQQAGAVARQLRGEQARIPDAPDALLRRIESLGAESRSEDSSTSNNVEERSEPGARTDDRSTGRLQVRVDTSKLDYLLDMVGEMVIAQAMLRHDPELNQLSNPRIQRNLSHLSRVTEEVQKVAMATRMVSIDQLFKRLERLVRDLGRKEGKRVELLLSGQDTELDKTIVEQLADPLMHMIRNAVDHGIETPEQRLASGKPEQARIWLRAAREAESIEIEVRDDGRGLDTAKIRAKAIERKLIQPTSALSDDEICNLIFEPGFSTADKVSELSGRGVGMDVVRRQIQRLRGRVEMHSVRGEGTAFKLRLPLTLAIIDGLIVGLGGERFIIPLFAVHEMLRPEPTSLGTINGVSEMVMIREKAVPVLRLERLLRIPAAREPLGERLLIVAGQTQKRYAIAVDEFLGKQEVVIKPLGEYLRNLPGIAGGAILGDGRVGLILDLEALYHFWSARSPN